MRFTVKLARFMYHLKAIGSFRRIFPKNTGHCDLFFPDLHKTIHMSRLRNYWTDMDEIRCKEVYTLKERIL
jgi:hypothetical protein